MRASIAAATISLAHACVLTLTWTGVPVASAGTSNPAPANPRLVAWVAQALADNPELAAVAAGAEAAGARAEGAGRPIYNPELELEYEHSDIDKTTAVLSQTVDWHGKREARQTAADGNLTAARAEQDAVRERLTGELLVALAEYEDGRAAIELAERQAGLMGRFAKVARERGKAGDLGQTEVELAELANVEGELTRAREEARLTDVLDSLQRIAGTMGPPKASLPQVPAETLPRAGPAADLAARHPEVQVARSRALAAAAAVRRADRDRWADPSIGVKGGREDREMLVGLRLTIPLPLRNDFRAEVDAAHSESNQAAQVAGQVERQVLARLAAAETRYRTLRGAWQVWERQGRGGLERRLKLLDRLWDVGELTTTDYLVQVKQSLEAETAGLTLRRELRQAWLAWLRAAGQVQTWLGLEHGGDGR